MWIQLLILELIYGASAVISVSRAEAISGNSYQNNAANGNSKQNKINSGNSKQTTSITGYSI